MIAVECLYFPPVSIVIGQRTDTHLDPLEYDIHLQRRGLVLFEDENNGKSSSACTLSLTWILSTMVMLCTTGIIISVMFFCSYLSKNPSVWFNVLATKAIPNDYLY